MTAKSVVSVAVERKRLFLNKGVISKCAGKL